MKPIIKYCLTTLISLSSSAIFALPDDFQKKLSIEADKVYLNEGKGSAIYEGNVVVKQGTIYIEATKLTISSSTSSKKYNLINAEGTSRKPAIFRQQLDDDGNIVSGQGKNILYNTASSTLEITGNGTIKRAKDIISADSIRYLMKKNIFEAKKKSGGERVSITLQPEGSNAN